MNEWLNLPWAEILIPKYPVEMFVRGTLAYLGILFILRVMLKRQSANLTLSDVLVTVLIADAIQNGMVGDYHSVPDGLLLVTTIVGWDYFIDWLTYRFTWLGKIMNPPPLLLIDKGRILRKHLHHEFISSEELWTALREEGIDDIHKVKAAYLESDGKISVIKK